MKGTNPGLLNPPHPIMKKFGVKVNKGLDPKIVSINIYLKTEKGAVWNIKVVIVQRAK